jgi:hypothetical protein
MKRWRRALFAWFAVLVLFAACSGRSNDRERGHGEPSGGEPSEGGEAGEPSAGASGSDRTGGAGGLGGASGSAGAGAAGTSGGGGGPAGTGGAGGAGMGGSGTGGAPFSWACDRAAYGDGVCDCGCTATDIDCADGDIDTCEVCDRTGSCSGAPCPGRIDRDNTSRCQPVPTEWRCSTNAYADESTCHCGCGTVDPDCPNDNTASCDVCNLPGSCALGSCPSAIDPDDNSGCRVPRGWTCIRSLYGDGRCDCGCGVPDLDCASSSVEDCDDCSKGCSLSACPGSVAPHRNAFCTSAPVEWSCSPLVYNDGSVCDCGCGAIDLDCDSAERASCDRCNVEDSCSGQSCPGTIDPEFNGACVRPDPPPGWTCSELNYGDGIQCDCGCGVLDADCRSNSVAECESCNWCGVCPGRVDPSDTSRCTPPPAGWTCEDFRYGDLLCDCGCGIRDPDCASALVDDCRWCPESGCSRSDCRDIDPVDNARCDGGVPDGWTCSPYVYEDEVCDCGCGARDADCASASRTDCDSCDTDGGCSTTTCPGTISATDNALCD